MVEQKKYQPQQLSRFLESELEQNFTGVLSLETQVTSWQQQKSCVLAIRRGAIVYGGSKIPTNQELAKLLGAKLNSSLINAAVSMAKRKIDNPSSVQGLIEILVKFKVFTWKEVENVIESQVISILEKLAPYPGKGLWELSSNFDLSYGQDGHSLDWSKIKQELNRRQQQWVKLAPQIPGMDGIPRIGSRGLDRVTDPLIKKHLQEYVDGKNTLLDIAEKMDKEPFKVAKSYLKWVHEGWVSFGSSNSDRVTSEINTLSNQNLQSTSKQANGAFVNLPTVLSVDDSPIVQISIKRALQNHYQVILASKAAEALDILSKQKIDLLLLDLTMPDVDGLEFCKTIRQMTKFRDLPIVMVTARDGLIDKMKGQIAGTNKYLTKPFEPEELLEVVNKYIQVYQT